MAGLINRRGFGTQPQPVSTSAVRRGRGGGSIHRRPGSMGGGGGGQNRLPNTGLYRGRAGEAQANRDPEAFLRAAVRGVGGLDYSGTPISQFSESAVAALLDEYNAALAGRQRTSPVDFLRQQYGAGFLGRKGRQFRPGTLATSGVMGEGFEDWYSNEMTNDFVTGRLTGQGGYIPGGGNAAYQGFVQEQGVPDLLAEVASAREANPHLSVADLIAGRDLAGQMRRRYLARPNAQRQIGPANLGARWSWWE